MKLSVIVVLYQSAGELSSRWEGWRAAARGSEGISWVFVDNASSDESSSVVQSLQERFPLPGDVVILCHTSNQGFGTAANAAVAAAPADADLFFLNPDATPSAGFFPALPRRVATAASALEREGKRLGAWIPLMADANGALQGNCGPFPSAWHEAAELSGIASLFGGGRYYRPRAPADAARFVSGPVGWAGAGALYVSREGWRAARGFDPAYFLYLEDVDFSLRLAAAGFSAWLDAGMTVSHAGQSSSADTAAGKARWRRYGWLSASMRRFHRAWLGDPFVLRALRAFRTAVEWVRYRYARIAR